MSLIKCPECNGNVSDSAKTCPHCGYALFNNDQQEDELNETEIKNKARKNYWEVYLFSFLIPLVGFIIGSVLMSKKTPVEKYAGDLCIGLGVISIIISAIIVGVRYVLIVMR